MKSKSLIIMFGVMFAFICSWSAFAASDQGTGSSSVIDYLNSDWLGEKPTWAPDVSGSLYFVSKYIWRGATFVDAPSLQSDLSFSKYGFTFDWWTNYSMSNDKANGSYHEYTEVDYTVDYTFNWA
ncbi:MAG: hypothetical protein PHQ52_04400, partial [Candidatus Omnitrophica bacterium]|nr:hypothetical protein [Candidatus Omnitrophota bacterium]